MAPRKEKLVNPFGLGGVFLKWSIDNGWIVHKQSAAGHKYVLTQEGEKVLTSWPFQLDLEKVITDKPINL